MAFAWSFRRTDSASQVRYATAPTIIPPSRSYGVCPVMPGFWGFFGFFLEGRLGLGRGMVLGRWRDGLERWFCDVVLSGFARIFGYLVAAGGLRGATVSRPYRRCMVWRMGWVGGWGCRLAGVAGLVLRGASFSNSKKLQRSERRLSFRLCDPGEPPQLEVAGGSGRRVLSRGLAAQLSRAAMVHDCARSPSRWMSTSRAVRRLASAVTLSSVIRGGDEPRGELSVLARKRSGDRGDLSFPVVTGIG